MDFPELKRTLELVAAPADPSLRRVGGGSAVDGPDCPTPATSSVPPSRVPGSMGVRVSLPQSASHRNAAGGDPKGSEDRADRTTEEQPNSLLRLLRPHSTTRECGRFSWPIGPICRVGRCGARSRTSECARSAPRSRLASGPSRPTSAPSHGPICRVGRCGARSRTSECARSAPRSRLASGPSRPTSAPSHRAHLPRWSLRCSLTHVRVRSLRSSLPPCIWTLSADERPIP